MCRAFEEVREEGRLEGRAEGRAEGKAEGKAEGEARFASLLKLLMKDKQYSEIDKASSDKAYRDSLFLRYGL